MVIDFPPFTLDDERHQLLENGVEVSLSLKGYEFLKLLLETRPRVVKTTELHESLWPSTFVADATLRSVVAEVRAALREPAGTARLIRTVRRVGYAFSGDATTRGAAAAVSSVPALYWLTLGGREFPLHAGENLVGRDKDATVQIEDLTVSRRHARLVVAADRAILEDLDSRNGTFAQEVRITAATAIQDGDNLRFGGVRLTFRSLATPGSTVGLSSGPRATTGKRAPEPSAPRTSS